MPRPEINDYTFYKIVNVNGDCEMCYVGSSCNMKHRRRTHKNSCNNPNAKEYNYKVYKTIREHGGWCEFQIVELGTAEQLTLTESLVIEETYRIELKAVMNTRKCYGAETLEQYKKEYYKQYSIDNVDKLKEKHTCDCGGKYTTTNKSKHIKTATHQNYLSKFKPESAEVDGQE